LEPPTAFQHEYGLHNKLNFHSLEREPVRDDFDFREFTSIRNLEPVQTPRFDDIQMPKFESIGMDIGPMPSFNSMSIPTTSLP
jgi:hypothetical protein